jgi:hypothetical protein
MTTHIDAYSKETTGVRHRADLEYTAGTGAASQPLVLDVSGNVTTPGNVTVAGTLTAAVVNAEVQDNDTGITAFATGGQANATALAARWNNVTTVATAADSVKLPAASDGGVIAVKNSGAATLAIFPGTGDAINARAVNLSIDLPPGGEIEFRAIDATTWETIESLYLPAPTTQTGGLELKAADNAGNFTVTLTNASMAANRTLTLPDPGAAASVVMTEGAQSLNGLLTLSGANVHSAANTFTAGAAAAAIAARFGASATEGLEVRVIDETTGVLAAVSTDLTEDVPAGAVILSVQGNVETALTGGGTTVNWGIGTVADPDKYSPTVGALTLDAKIDNVPDWAVLAGAEDIQVHGVTAGGAIGDTALTVGTVRVRIVYLALNSLDNA